jgi:uncharacterized protein
MKKLGIWILILTAVAIFQPTRGFSQQPITNLSALSGPFNTGSYVLTAALEELSKKNHPWLRITAAETPGLVFNITKLYKEPPLRKDTIISFTLAIDWLASNGQPPFKEKLPPVKLLANYNLGTVWLVSLNPKIKTPQDLIGKKVALGRAAQILWSIEPEWIIRYGWGLGDKIKLELVGTDPAPAALLDGLVDAAVIGGYIDPITGKFAASPQTMELMASGRQFYHIPWGAEAIKKVIERGIPIAPVTLPANTIDGMKEPFASFVDPIAWVAYAEFPDELAYETTKLIIQNVEAFKGYHNLGELMSPKALPFGWPQDKIHPGALRAYKEAKIIE